MHNTSPTFKFSASVALFGLLLSNSEFTGQGDYKLVIDLAQNARENDESGYRAEFVRLVETVK